MANTQETAREALNKPQVSVRLSEETWQQRAPRSPWRDAVRRLLHNKLALVGMAIIGIVVLIALLAPILAQQHPNENGVFKVYPRDRKLSPSLEHPNVTRPAALSIVGPSGFTFRPVLPRNGPQIAWVAVTIAAS